MSHFKTLRAALKAVNTFYGFMPIACLRERDIYARRLFNDKYLIIQRENGFEIWRIVDSSGRIAICARCLTLKEVFTILPEPIKVELSGPRFIRKSQGMVTA